MTAIKPLPDIEAKVLAVLAGGSDDFGVHSFAGIGRYVRLKRSVIRRACRSLKRKGFASFHFGCWTEDGDPAGSGYAATKEGRARADGKLVEKYARRRWE